MILIFISSESIIKLIFFSVENLINVFMTLIHFIGLSMMVYGLMEIVQGLNESQKHQ